ncbi:MAG: hypothetical protein Q8L26_08470 [Candidatus Omnitrophota bacterium]|nr:hypothetical protein [Candidatus Omnitrophota bacterium]
MNLKKFTFEKEIEGIFEDYIKGLTHLLEGDHKDVEREFISLAEDYPNLFIPNLFYNEGLYAFREGNVDEAEKYFLKAIKAFAIFEVKGNIVETLPFLVNEIMPVDKKYKEVFNADSLVLMAGYLRDLVTTLKQKKWIKAFFNPDADKNFKRVKKHWEKREELRPENPFLAMGVKIKTIYALHDCLNFKAVDFNTLDEAKKILRNIRYKKGKESIDAIENFVLDFEELVRSKHHKSINQISKDDGHRLMSRLRVASDLSNDLSCFMAEKQSREMFKEDITESVGGEIKKQMQRLGDSLTKRIRVDKRVKPEAEKAEYGVWFNDSEPKGKSADTKQKEDIIANLGKYALFISREETRTQAFINGKKVRAPSGKLTYRVLSYILKHKGSGGTAWNMAQHVFDVRYAIDFKDVRELVKAIKIQPDLDRAKRQAAEELFKDKVEDISKKLRRRIEDLNNLFFKKLNAKLKANEMDEYELIPMPNYCLIEKI